MSQFEAYILASTNNKLFFCFSLMLGVLLLSDELNHDHCAIIKSGVACNLIFEMDDETFKRHLRLSRRQFDVLSQKLDTLRGEHDIGRKGVPAELRCVMVLWYMANQNSFREMADKFNVSQSTAHDIITQTLRLISTVSSEYITWPGDQEKQTSIGVFCRITKLDNIIGAVDGCHIKIQRLSGPRGGDYMNRKGYFSILLQGICNDEGKLINIFVVNQLIRISNFTNIFILIL